MSEDGGGLRPPYISFKTFSSLLERLETSGVPQRIDRHYWGSFLGGSVGGNLMSALRFLELIDEGNHPTDLMATLVDSQQRKDSLSALLRRRYAPALVLADPERATPGHLTGAFRTEFRIDGETLRKAVAFFVHAWQYADLPVSTHISDKARPGAGPSRRPAARRARVPPPSDKAIGEQANVDQSVRQQERVKEPEAEGRYGILHQMVRELPKDGQWSEQRRDQWLAGLTAMLDYVTANEKEIGDEPMEE